MRKSLCMWLVQVAPFGDSLVRVVRRGKSSLCEKMCSVYSNAGVVSWDFSVAVFFLFLLLYRGHGCPIFVVQARSSLQFVYIGYKLPKAREVLEI